LFPVKDQGLCDSSQFITAINTISSRWALKTGQLLELSEQQLEDCDSTTEE